MTDPIADLLTRIRNAYLAGHSQVEVPHSNLKRQLVEKLQSLGYFSSVTIKQADKNTSAKTLVIKLKYQNKLPTISSIKRISKPGRRVYLRSNKITSSMAGFDTTLVSTSQGIMTGKEARKTGIGGEIICHVW